MSPPPETEPSPPATILVVDDEAAVRDFVRLALVHAGYAVQLATDAPCALDAVRASPDKFALVLTDVRMPGRSGADLADDLRAVAPAVPVAFISGFSSGPAHQPIALPPGAVVLDKPFSVEQLVRAVRQAIG